MTLWLSQSHRLLIDFLSVSTLSPYIAHLTVNFFLASVSAGWSQFLKNKSISGTDYSLFVCNLSAVTLIWNEWKTNHTHFKRIPIIFQRKPAQFEAIATQTPRWVAFHSQPNRNAPKQEWGKMHWKLDDHMHFYHLHTKCIIFYFQTFDLSTFLLKAESLRCTLH